MIGPLRRLVEDINLPKDTAGAAFVEAAVVLPILMVLGFVGFEFANIFYSHQLVTTGIRDAARFLARDPHMTLSAVGSSCTLDATYMGYARNLAVYGDVTTGTRTRVPGWDTGQVTIRVTPVANGTLTYRGTNPLCVITVSTSFTYRQIGMLRAFNFADQTLSVTHSERWIGG
jgi:Flp pilus assembly protein TadG